MASPEMLMSR